MTTRTPRTRLTRSIVTATGLNAGVYLILALSNADTYDARAWTLIGSAGVIIATVGVLGVRRVRALPVDASTDDVAGVQRRVGAALLAGSLLGLVAFAWPALSLVLGATTS